MKLYTLDGQFIKEVDVEPIDFTGISVYNEGTGYQIKFWLKDGLTHRDGGPACEYIDGHKEYWHNGKYHRLDGPAVEYFDNSKEYYIYDLEYSEEKFNLVAPLLMDIMKLKGLK